MATIGLLEEQHCTDILPFVCEQFVYGSVLHQALNIKPEDYVDYMEKALPLLIRSGASFVASNPSNGEVLGCILTCDFDAEQSVDAPKFLQPIGALTRALELRYSDLRSPSAAGTLLVDIAVVAAAARGQGIYRALRQAVHDKAKQLGYGRVVGELSSAATQKMCVQQLGHRLVCEIDYATFEFEGRYPFAGISTPRSIQLAETLI